MVSSFSTKNTIFLTANATPGMFVFAGQTNYSKIARVTDSVVVVLRKETVYSNMLEDAECLKWMSRRNHRLRC